jgi:dipeptidyl aminopeptidase/acylaminoacyl peptidase
MTTVAPYGTWPSPITAAVVAESGIGLSDLRLVGGAAWWLEMRPGEGGRHVLVRRDPAGGPVDVTPAGFDVRTRVHEYGGGAWWPHGDAVVFSNLPDQRLYRQEPGGAPRPITPDVGGTWRFADGIALPDDRLLCVRERHEGGAVRHELVALPPDGSEPPTVVAAGPDFCSTPRVSPDGRRLAWLTWDHPRMPWDGTELRVAELLPDGTLGEERIVAGGPEESVFQPAWSPDGALHFVSDRTGWWNLYRLGDDGAVALAPMEAEFGQPQWLFGMATYGFLADRRIVCAYDRDGQQRLAILDPGTGELLDLDVPYTHAGWSLDVQGHQVLFLGASPSRSERVVLLDLLSREVEELRASFEVPFEEAFFPPPETIAFPTDGGETAHAFFYRPAHPDVVGPEGERPPLVVMAHGGPTAATSSALDLRKRFWTSRGFAVVDVNYRGSTGYGRAYRERLRGNWGLVDVADCVGAARFLAERGDVDPARMVIRGGSAGGYATLCALTFHDAFAAGASYYGIGDLEAFVRETHDFESRYLDGLVGPYPEAAGRYRERSPLRHLDRLSRPVLVLQGAEDEIVPPTEGRRIVEALAAKGIPHAYLEFEGEQHGFRKAENVARALLAELSFYGQVLGFRPADPMEPLRVEHLAG